MGKLGYFIISVFFISACGGKGGGGGDVEPNNTVATAQSITSPFSVRGSLAWSGTGGDEFDYFSLDTVATTTYTATLSNLSKDADLSYIGLDSMGTQVESGASIADAPGGASTETVSFTATSGVSYYIIVEAFATGSLGYTLTVAN